MYNNKIIGIVILNYNDSETVLNLYNLIKSYESIDYIVIVDNQSTDNSYKKLKRLNNNKIQVIQTDSNKGYSYGNNFGVWYLTKKYHVDIVFIANPDVEFSEKFITQIINDMEKNNAKAASGYMNQVGAFKMNRYINTYWREVINITFLRKFFPLRTELVTPRQGILQVEWLPGSLFAVDTRAYKNVHGMDESFFLFYEEQILGIKFKDKGYKMIIDTDIEYVHNHSVSINKVMKPLSKMRQLYKSKYRFFVKYEHIGLLKRIIMKLAIHYSLFHENIKNHILYFYHKSN